MLFFILGAVVKLESIGTNSAYGVIGVRKNNFNSGQTIAHELGHL